MVFPPLARRKRPRRTQIFADKFPNNRSSLHSVLSFLPPSPFSPFYNTIVLSLPGQMGGTRSLESLKKRHISSSSNKIRENAGHCLRSCGVYVSVSTLLSFPIIQLETSSSLSELTVKCQLYFLFYPPNLLFFDLRPVTFKVSTMVYNFLSQEATKK